ncbi:Na(+)/H(+) antiporter subunit C [Raineyella fluvialis]|uniref:Na(+)/H(+) antiporter subunit C n=1 Tax=Raineyella fluvialis TaxID=2662261 RepID=A0A5Q2FCZ9_9ACTN|nr:Na(+)/H(+) antiporter subunit C [Raineyella fluvialis]QGF24980.1 Na(+)/H(+) antiporter subunit C [Raineyella fluvialis]
MEPNITLLLVSGFLIACGVYLLLERSLTRILMGILLASNGVNLLYPIIAGRAGLPAFIGLSAADRITDPLPQAMVLTSIVITLATTAFLLTMAYRAFQVNGHDEVQDDVEDAVIRRLALLDEASESYDAGVTHGEPGEEAGSDTHETTGAARPGDPREGDR